MVPPRPSNKRKLLQLPYPENLLMTLLEGIVETIDVTPDKQAGLDYGTRVSGVYPINSKKSINLDNQESNIQNKNH